MYELRVISKNGEQMFYLFISVFFRLFCINNEFGVLGIVSRSVKPSKELIKNTEKKDERMSHSSKTHWIKDTPKKTK